MRAVRKAKRCLAGGDSLRRRPLLRGELVGGSGDEDGKCDDDDDDDVETRRSAKLGPLSAGAGPLINRCFTPPRLQSVQTYLAAVRDMQSDEGRAIKMR